MNRSGERLWIGSTVNADGSVNFAHLPTLRPGQSATVAIPRASGHWRGKFFARQGCSGTSGVNFHCQVGDCGVHADHCTTGEQPASLAEFNFDSADPLAPWYDVSYVNAFSLPITIGRENATAHCGSAGCSTKPLRHCPAGDLQRRPDGSPLNCVNPSRDTQTTYSNLIQAHYPKAYAWSKQDTEPGNQVMHECATCRGFTITFHGISPRHQRAKHRPAKGRARPHRH